MSVNLRDQTRIPVISGIFHSVLFDRGPLLKPDAACLYLFIRSNFSKRQAKPRRGTSLTKAAPAGPCRVLLTVAPRVPDRSELTVARKDRKGEVCIGGIQWILIDYFPPIDASGYHCACLQNVTDVRVTDETCAHSTLSLK